MLSLRAAASACAATSWHSSACSQSHVSSPYLTISLRNSRPETPSRVRVPLRPLRT
ncbi:hypothetical protein PF005_g4417 [Phytophthora fragariae]|uniref:Uncharacterized protein n=1 Tax=Phytophthora fragariae TaxID=53985 RepID=A0A6A3Z0D5_9STRA|nr:hypothetical protein PF009_g4650 [Phytophthora fragariae]KAE9228172.1 hypothetical protein PF005_g4417 [Phytophthora fragariae]KAE9354444.1 hypothetical protein PF008_g4529 [Phytophthora fragariae]